MSGLVKELKFGNVHAPNNLIFAPLAGFSHKAMRMCIRDSGAGYCVTEMVSIEGALRGSIKTMNYADISDAPHLSSIQLFGEDPVRFTETALLMKEHYNSISININFGCPAPKVQRGGGGSQLLKEPHKIKVIVRALKSTGLTVEAKIRAGYDEDCLEELLDAVEDADCIMLHCRLVKDKFLAGSANWNFFERARKHTSTCFIANGDIKTPEDALTVINRYGVDGVMIGRSALAKPYIFQQIQDLDKLGHYAKPSADEKIEMLLSFAKLWAKINDSESITSLRGALMSRIDNFDGAVRLRSAIAQCSTLTQLTEIISQFKTKSL